MATISTEDPQLRRAIQACTVALRRMADYELDPSLHRRMHELDERKRQESNSWFGHHLCHICRLE